MQANGEHKSPKLNARKHSTGFFGKLGSVRPQPTAYLEPLIEEKKEEVNSTTQYLGRVVLVGDLLREVIKGIKEVKPEPRRRE